MSADCLGLEILAFPLAGQQAVSAGLVVTAGNGASCGHQFTVQGHQGRNEPAFPYQGFVDFDGLREVFHDNRASQQRLHDGLELGVVGHQVRRPANDAGQVVRQVRLAVIVGASQVQRPEGHTAGSRRFQKLDTATGVFVPLHNHVGQVAAERGFERHFLATLDGDEVRHQAQHAGKLLGVGENEANPLAVSGHLRFQVP